MELIEKLREDLKISEGKRRFELMNSLAWEYRSAFPDSAIKYAGQALLLSDQLKLDKGPAKSLNYIGLAHYYKGNFVRAYDNYESALSLATNSSDSVEMGYALNNIGRLFSEQGMMTQSYPYFVKAELIFKSSREPSGLAYVYQSFGALYRLQEDFVKAEQYYHRALKIRETLGNTRDITSALALLGMLYADIQRFDDAILFFNKADSTSRVINDALAQAEIKILIGEYYLNKGNVDEAGRLSKEGLTYIVNFNNVKLTPRAHLVLGKVDLERGDYPAAQQHFMIAKRIATRMKYIDLEMQANNFLWKVSEATGNRSDALFYSNRYLMLKDSINNLDISERVAKFQFQLEIDRKQRENELLKTMGRENQATILHQNQQRVVLILVLTLSVALLYFQWSFARKQRRANVVLTEQRDQIAAQAAEISRLNETLEKRVMERTLELENQIAKAQEASNALKANEERYRSIISVSNTGAWEYHSETDLIWCSPQYFSMIGLERPDGIWSESVQEVWTERLHPDDRENATNTFATFLSGDPASLYENVFRMRHESGDWVWIWSRARRLRDAMGNISSITLGTHIDITARKKAEEKIEQNAQLVRKITNQVPANTYMFEIFEGGKTNILFLNRGTDEFNHNLDLKGEPENSDRLKEILHEDDRVKWVEKMKEAYETSLPVSFQYRIIVDNNVRWRWMKAIPDKDESGKILWYGATSDITSMVDYIVSVEQIIFDIGHVIRRPVASMLGMTRLIIDNDLTIGDIKDISQKLNQISEEMDKFSRELNDAYLQKSQLGKFNIDVSSSIDKRSTLFT